MSVRQYIGARYVTKIYENSLDPSSAEWEASVNYEPLTMVTYNYGSYLSKKQVPASVGNPADNPTYWTQTGFYNGQIADLQNQINNTNARIDVLDTHRIIMLGDSYGNRVNNDGKTYFDLIAENFNFSLSDFYHNNVAGASFYHNTPEATFLYLLQQIENNVSDPDTITDIIIVCGANDANYTYNETASALATFASYCKLHYPAATVSIIAAGLTFTNVICSRLRNITLQAFCDAAQFNIKLVDNSQYILRDSLLLEADVCHPNADGVDVIAAKCIEYIKYNQLLIQESYNYAYDSNTGFAITLSPDHSATVVNPTINCSILKNNGITAIYAKYGTGVLSFTTNINITFNANDVISCTLPRRLFYGYTPDGTTNTYFKCFLVNQTTFEKIECTAYIKAIDNSLTLELIVDNNATNAGYQYYVDFTPVLIQ